MQASLHCVSVEQTATQLRGKVEIRMEETCVIQRLRVALVQHENGEAQHYWGMQTQELSLEHDAQTGWLFHFAFSLSGPDQKVPLGEHHLAHEEQDDRHTEREAFAAASSPRQLHVWLSTDKGEIEHVDTRVF
ncbi:MAG: hypothetical protein AB8F95_06350 [Bacteroidia bacterium]